MARKKIFIGSSSEAKPLAQKIADVLDEGAFKALRWWNSFQGGDITIQKLLTLATEVDGAVFLMTAADKSWYRNLAVDTPRDNVVLEYGMFVAQVGLKRTLIVSDASTKLPSDLLSVTYAQNADDMDVTAQRVLKHFADALDDLGPPASEVIPVIAEPSIIRHHMEPFPQEWHERALYYGSGGARAWRDVALDPDYSQPALERSTRDAIVAVGGQADVRTMMSLGPGDGERDVELVQELRKREAWLQYIPVDISDGLLHLALGLVSRQDVWVPVGILADFESSLNFIMAHVDTYASPPILYSLLGNTLGSIDGTEKAFLANLVGRMIDGDRLLIDVALRAPEGDPNPRRRHECYPKSLRRFIMRGVAAKTFEPLEALCDQFENRIEFREGSTSVEGCDAVMWYDCKEKLNLGTVRSYEWEPFLKWLGLLQVRVLDSRTVPADGPARRGIVLLGK